VLVGGSLAAGAASALNCYIDRDIDQLMRRTRRRPLPAHSVTPAVGTDLRPGAGGDRGGLMGAFTNWLATALTAAAIAYYDLVYTLWLKRRTPQNTFWGGDLRRGAGAHRMGRRDRLDRADGLGAFCVVFFWQMPHFYALAVTYKDDYARAGVPMLPVVRPARRARRDPAVHRPHRRGVAGGLAARSRRDLRGAAVVLGDCSSRGVPAGRPRPPGDAGQADAAVPLVRDVPHDLVHRGGDRRPGVAPPHVGIDGNQRHGRSLDGWKVGRYRISGGSAYTNMVGR
jgi:hypothetical protein